MRIDRTLLDEMDSAAIHKFAVLSGAPARVRRDEATQWIESAFDDPERLTKSLSRLSALELTLLGVLRDLGGACTDRQMLGGFLAAGGTFQRRNAYQDSPFYESIESLLKAGILLHYPSDEGLSLSRLNAYWSYRPNNLVADERLLMQLPITPTVAPDLTPLQGTWTPQVRAPQSVSMLIVPLVQAIARINGVSLTQAGKPRVSEIKKINKELRQSDSTLKSGPFQFEKSVENLLFALRQAGVLAVSEPDNRLILTVQAESFLQQDMLTLAGNMLHAAIDNEFQSSLLNSNSPVDAPQCMAALYCMLCAIPVESDQPLAFSDFEKALFDRLASYVIKDSMYAGRSSYTDLSDPKQYAHVRRTWELEYLPVITRMLTGWFHFLGLVELYGAQEKPVGLRISRFGAALLHPETAPDPALLLPVEDGPAWVVQPNFDILAFLNRLTPAQLTFLEAHAERRNLQQHVAEYRLTRDSVYRGFESGSAVQYILDELRAGTDRDLPQNLSAELRDWANQHERITLIRAATLVEYDSTAERLQALTSGIKGKPVGERYLLVESISPALHAIREVVNYHQAAQRNLLLDESGNIQFYTPNHDLILSARLRPWTVESKPSADNGNHPVWRTFTAASIRATVATGRSVDSLLALLEERQYRIAPPILRLAIRAWAGRHAQVALGKVVLLQTTSAELNYALQNAQTLRPYLTPTAAPGLFLVAEENVETVKEILTGYGIAAADTVIE